MKKLFFIAALGVAGMMSASETSNNICSSSSSDNAVAFSLNLNTVSLVPTEREWVTVTTGCGKVFFLDANMYDSYEGLQEDSRIFTDAQCGEGFGFNLPY